MKVLNSNNRTVGSAVVVVIFAFVLSFTEGVSWTEGDAVFIEDGSLLKRFEAAEEEEALRKNVGRSSANDTLGWNETWTEPGSTPVPPLQTAIPVEVVPGRCIKFSECFPLLFFPQESGLEPRMTNNRNLYEFILSTSDSCEPSDLPVGRSSLENSDDVYIWCRERKNSPRPGYVLSSGLLVDSKAEKDQDLLNGSCGPVKSSSSDGEEVGATSTASTIEEGEGEDNNDGDDDKVKARVVGGEEADLGEFPWMVALLSRGKQVCGGSLLDRTHVLIAAHCISHLKPSHLPRLKVLVGDHDIKDPTDIEHQERNVTAVIFHEEFTSVTIHSDVGLLVLSEPVDLADNVAPICLYGGGSSSSSPAFDDGSTYATMAGWGQTGENEKTSSVLLKTSLRIWTNEECNKKYAGKAPAGITPGMVCAGVSDPEVKDACRGDSGGPLFFVRDNKTQQIGIVSWGIGCGKYPGVFTRVPKYLDWIKEKRSLALKYFKK